MIVTPLHDDLVWPRELAVAAAFGRQIDDDGSRLHRFDHLGRHENGRRFAGNERGRDDDVATGDDLDHHLALAAVERFVLGLGVAALVFRVSDSSGSSSLAPRLCTCSLTAGRTS